MFFLEIVFYFYRLFLSAAKKASDSAHHLVLAMRAFSAHGIRFYILIQHLVRIQFRTVAGKEKQMKPTFLFCHPVFRCSRSMDRMAIHDQKQFPLDLPCQTTEKCREDNRRKSFPINHEIQLAPVGDCRDHVAAKPLSRTRNHGSLSLPAIRGTGLMIGTHPHLVSPVNLSLLLLGLCPNRRIFFLKPFLHGLRIPLKGSPQGFLRRKSPILQVTPHGPNRQRNAMSLLDQTGYRLPGPKIKRQLQLIGIPVGDGPNNLCRLPRLQGSSRRSSLTACFESPASSFPIRLDPSAYRLARHTEQLGRFLLSPASLHCFYSLAAKILLGNRGKGSCVFNLHAYSYSMKKTLLQPILCSG